MTNTTTNRPSDSCYDRAIGGSVTALLAALRLAYPVECHWDGSVTVNGDDIGSVEFERRAIAWDGTADGLDELGYGLAALLLDE